MTFQNIIEACDEVDNRDLIRIDTYPYVENNEIKFDNYHTLKLTSTIEVIYNAVNVPSGYAYAVQEALVTKNFECFNRLVNQCWVSFDYNCLPNYAILKYKDYYIGKLYGVTHYKELFELIERAVY